ncbi:MAG: cation-translocating P-type ATPase, partial [Planctomycetaceae bacterium]
MARAHPSGGGRGPGERSAPRARDGRGGRQARPSGAKPPPPAPAAAPLAGLRAAIPGTADADPLGRGGSLRRGGRRHRRRGDRGHRAGQRGGGVPAGRPCHPGARGPRAPGGAAGAGRTRRRAAGAGGRAARARRPDHARAGRRGAGRRPAGDGRGARGAGGRAHRREPVGRQGGRGRPGLDDPPRGPRHDGARRDGRRLGAGHGPRGGHRHGDGVGPDRDALERGGPETTPLQRRLAALGRTLVVVCLAVVTVIGGLELARGEPLAEVFLRAVSLAVAAVPEGLPAVVTLVLAAGLQRLAAQNALVRRLPGVETLGSVTVICTDKTGTLTRGEMTVRSVVTATDRLRVTGAGYAPRGAFLRESGGPPVAVGTLPDVTRLLLIALRCNNATLAPDAAGGWRALGDPTEAALVAAAMKGGVEAGDREALVHLEIPFDAARRMMSVVVAAPGGRVCLESKGATEAILPRCVAELRGGRVEPLTPERRRAILADAHALAAGSLRVLSLAYRDLDEGAITVQGAAAAERDLVHVGLVGLLDPPREEARDAVARCRSAGIVPVMITGDHPATALAIGRELGLVDGTSRAVTGAEVARLSDDALAAAVEEIAIYARVTAEDKLRVVRAWQRRGEVVAMTGDGVNDAPALKKADIGIAMGKSGTFVTREAADMVLTDDDFASIVGAVEEGRGIYDNIQKFIHYLLACNAGEVLVMLVAAVAGWPPPLAAIQIL